MLAEVAGAQVWTSPGGQQLYSRFLAPVPITRDNLDLVIDAGWVAKAVVCKGVIPGSVAACD